MTTKPQTIFRVIKSAENPFVMMDKRALSDPKLSYKAKGILAYLLSRPDNWTINVSDVVNHSPDGEFAVRTGIKELIAAGYVQRKVERNEKHIIRWVMEVYEQPIQPAEKQAEAEAQKDVPETEQPDSGEKELDRGNLQIGFPDVGNRDINNTDSSKKENMGAAAPARPAAPKPGKTKAEKSLPERIAAFPADCQPGSKSLAEIFNLRPPEKPAAGEKGGDFALWIKGLRELNKIAAEYDTPLELALRHTWGQWNKNPFNVSHPGALAKTMTSVLAQSNAGQNQASVSAPTALELALKAFKPRT